MSTELPALLRAALARELEGVSRKGLAERAARTSEAYRAGQPSGGVIRGASDALAYALARLPATFAACITALAEAARLAPAFQPRSLLDAGCGPGGASWAVLETWPGVETVSWLDENPSFLELAATLAREGPAPLAAAQAQRGDLTADPSSWPRADVVLASYALAEIAPERQASVIAALWAASEGLLVLVEPGTPAGFARLHAARTLLIDQGGAVLAPCPHAGPCPVAPPDWCHFSVRLPRSRDHKLAKSAQAPFEDEPFAYLVVARPAIATAPYARVLAPPRVGKAGIEFKLCTPAATLERRLVARRDKAAHAIARRLDWGDATDENV